MKKMKNPFPDVYILTAAEGAQASILGSEGIEMVVMCGAGLVWPHSDTIAMMSINIEQDAAQPDWVVRWMARLLVEGYGVKRLALVDRQDGMGPASFMLICAVAEKQGVSYSAARTVVSSALGIAPGDLKVTSQLDAQGEALWP